MSKFMKNNLLLCLTGLGLVAAANGARADGFPTQVDVGFHANCVHGGVNCTLGPWYAYFPYEAHFQMPAPIGLYPSWPTPFPPSAPAMPAPEAAPSPRTAPPTPINFQQPPIQPIGYYNFYGYGYQVPGYWYGR